MQAIGKTLRELIVKEFLGVHRDEYASYLDLTHREHFENMANNFVNRGFFDCEHREPSHPFRTNYLYRACFVFCVGQFLLRARNARSVSARSGTEITKSLGACSEI